MQWKTVFDLALDGWKHLWPLPATLLFLPLLIWGLRHDLKKRAYGAARSVFAIFVLSVIVLGVGWGAIANVSSYFSLLQTEHRAAYRTIEGSISRFDAEPKSESFTVAGVRFEYSDYDVSPCFHNISKLGGPLGEGLYIRVAYGWDSPFQRNCIIRLQVGVPPKSLHTLS